MKGYGLPKADRTPSNFLKAVFHKFHLVHSWILCPIYIIVFHVVLDFKKLEVIVEIKNDICEYCLRFSYELKDKVKTHNSYCHLCH